MRALLLVVVSFFAGMADDVRAQATTRPACDGVCGVLQTIAPVTERQEWTPL